MFKKTLLALITLCLVAGCDSTQSLTELRNAAPAKDIYMAALASNYKEFAEQKAAAYDWEVSKYFADKGLMAAYGRDIGPEDPTNWDIAPSAMPELKEAYGKLKAAIDANRSTQPELTASAVVAYDRWVELAHRGWNSKGIAEAREVFLAILARLQEAHTDSTPEAQVAPVPEAAAPVPAPATKPETTTTILYFPFDDDHLGDSAKGALDQLVRYIQTAGNVTVSINGHADRVGTEQYNMDLSQRRARFVLEALKKAGVPPKIMNYFAFGETDPKVPTADGVPEPKNRRVEIFIE